MILALILAADLASRVAAAPDGEVRMTFAARPGICAGNHGRTYYGSDDDADVEWNPDCQPGPIRIVLWVAGHQPTKLHTYVGGQWRARPGTTITDLGPVSDREAADYLLGLAEHTPTHIGRDAIFPATLADSVTVWPRLIALARNADAPNETRKQAVFWLGQAAASATGALDSLANEPQLDRSVREEAIFALSQRPANEGVPILLRIARTNPDPALRRKAMFWLGQSGDPRALALFEAILTGPGH